MASQLIHREYNLIFITGREKLAEQVRNVSISLICQDLVAGITSPLSHWMFCGESKKIGNRVWMKTMDKILISSMLVENVCERYENKT
jgi:hypothetical protein